MIFVLEPPSFSQIDFACANVCDSAKQEEHALLFNGVLAPQRILLCCVPQHEMVNFLDETPPGIVVASVAVFFSHRDVPASPFPRVISAHSGNGMYVEEEAGAVKFLYVHQSPAPKSPAFTWAFVMYWHPFPLHLR